MSDKNDYYVLREEYEEDVKEAGWFGWSRGIPIGFALGFIAAVLYCLNN